MKPGRYNYRIVQGDTFQNTPVWKIASVPVNVTGYTSKLQVKVAANATTNVLELSTENGGITVGGTNGMFTFYMSPTDTAALTPGNYVYDWQVTAANGTQTTLMAGAFVITPQVTS